MIDPMQGEQPKERGHVWVLRNPKNLDHGYISIAGELYSSVRDQIQHFDYLGIDDTKTGTFLVGDIYLRDLPTFTLVIRSHYAVHDAIAVALLLADAENCTGYSIYSTVLTDRLGAAIRNRNKDSKIPVAQVQKGLDAVQRIIEKSASALKNY